jgi:hypothetical protein
MPHDSRASELPGPAAKVDDDVAGQAERADERVDHGRRVAASVLVIEIRDLAADAGKPRRIGLN